MKSTQSISYILSCQILSYPIPSYPIRFKVSAAATKAVSGVRKQSGSRPRRNDFEVTFSAEELGGEYVNSRRSLSTGQSTERDRGRYHPKQRSTGLPSNWAPSMGYANTPSTVRTEGERDTGDQSQWARRRGGENQDDDEEDEGEEEVGDVSDNKIVRGADNIVWIDGAPYSDLISPNTASQRQRGERKIEAGEGIYQKCERQIERDEEMDKEGDG